MLITDAARARYDAARMRRDGGAHSRDLITG